MISSCARKSFFEPWFNQRYGGDGGGGRWKRVEFYKYILKQEFSFVKYTQLFKVYKKKVLSDLSLFRGN